MNGSSSNVQGEASSGEGPGKCPVDHKNPSSLWRVLGVGGSKGDSSTVPAAADQKDPTQGQAQRRLPASLEEATRHAQTPHLGQRLPLSTHRAESSIPRGSAPDLQDVPVHQLGSESPNWVYPSEQQVFNAMKRKGWQGIEEEAIPSFLQVHNSVNERSWRQLCEWEGNRRDNVELVRFQGRPTDLSPKAWFLTTFMFEDRPFDRHDWYIDNGVDREKRYVLDFYMREGKAGLPRVDIDVRPALDSPQAVWQRGQRIAKEMFPGIAKELEKWQRQPSKASQQQQR